MTELSILQMLESGQSDLAWFEANLDALISKYNNKFVAFQNKQVLDVDTNVDILMKKLKQRGIDTSNIFVKFVSEIKAIL